MLKKLRNRIVLTNVLTVGVLVLAAAVIVCVLVCRSERNKINNRLDKTVQLMDTRSFTPQFFSDGFGLGDGNGSGSGSGSGTLDGSGGSGSGEGGIQPDIPRGSGGQLPGGADSGSDDIMRRGQYIPGTAVAVILDENNEIIASGEFSATMSEEALSFCIDKVLSSAKESGFISEVGVFYLRREVKSGTCIAFTDRTDFDATLENAVILAAVIVLLIMLLVFGVSIMLASLAVRPVKEAWDSQKQFIADASHELKTPLTVILANTNILESQTKDDRLQWIESTRDEADRMQQLIEEMLFLAKSDAGAFNIVKGDVNLSDLCEQSCLCFEPVAFDRGVSIETSVEPDVTEVTDGKMVERILGVLLDNAVKHAEKGSTITLSLGKTAQHTEILVHNFGDTIAPEDLPHIFDRFFKADKSRTQDSAENGFGLGLAIAHDIAERLGATLSAASSEQYGTTFRFTL
ncbi:MAG: HAMP domain-containing histidine kinase [Clostridia bacterium]|nr:HAMP domain-containing histidine kinase [Clostridia bacterium]